MQFTTNRLDLLAATEKVCATVPKKSVLPIIETIRITATPEAVTLEGTNMDTYCVSNIPLKEEAFSGSICVPAHRFLGLLKSIPGTLVTVSNPALPPKDDDPKDAPVLYSSKVIIESDTGHSQYTLTGEPGKDFPCFPPMEVHQEMKIDDTVRNALARAIPFTSADELRPAMRGVQLENDYLALTVVSTDGHRLYSNRIPERDWRPWERLLNADGLHTALKFKPYALAFNDDWSIYRCEGVTVTSRLIDETYPNWRGVVPAPAEMTGVTVFDRIEFLKLVRRILPFASSVKQVRLMFAGSDLNITVQDMDFGSEAKETMPSCFTRFDESEEPFEIGFSGTYLVDVLSALKSEQITMRLWTPTRAAILVTDSEAETMLLMPVRLNNYEELGKGTAIDNSKPPMEVLSDEKRKELMPPEEVSPRKCPNCERDIHDDAAEECWNCHTAIGPRLVETEDEEEENNETLITEACPGCGKQIEDGLSECPECKAELYSCDDCGATMLASAIKCPSCGTEYEAA